MGGASPTSSDDLTRVVPAEVFFSTVLGGLIGELGTAGSGLMCKPVQRRVDGTDRVASPSRCS